MLARPTTSRGPGGASCVRLNRRPCIAGSFLVSSHPCKGLIYFFSRRSPPRLLSPDRQKSSPRRRLTAEESASTIPRQSRYGGAASVERSPNRVFNTLRFDHSGTFVASASLSERPNSSVFASRRASTLWRVGDATQVSWKVGGWRATDVTSSGDT